jgi:hypothetical protein
MDVLIDAGMQATMNQTEMNVFVEVLNQTNPFGEPDQWDLVILMIIILPIPAGLVVILVVYIKRRKK